MIFSFLNVLQMGLVFTVLEVYCTLLNDKNEIPPFLLYCVNQ